MGSHIVDGQFQSDKYPTCPPGKVPLSVKDKTAQDLLWAYAQRRREVDAEFADDLERALQAEGFVPPPPMITFEEMWAKKEAEGFQYGHDALEQVRFGWELWHEHLNKKPGVLWNLGQGISFINKLLPAMNKAGFYLGLTGSVLFGGESRKDLDILVYPTNKSKCDFDLARAVLKEAGLTCLCTFPEIQEIRKKRGTTQVPEDLKLVEAWKTKYGQRVDFFFVS